MQPSYGEYVFDWGWADAYARHGYDYYPKLLTAIPFTPCRGPRLLGSLDAEQLQGMVQALQSQARALGASGWHCLFPETTLSERLISLAAPQRLSCQFHWYNRGYRDFDDFLSTMSSRKRKNILRERRQVAQQGFEFEHKRGEQITALVFKLKSQARRANHRGGLGLVLPALPAHLPQAQWPRWLSGTGVFPPIGTHPFRTLPAGVCQSQRKTRCRRAVFV